jgi:hypothetical protein
MNDFDKGLNLLNAYKQVVCRVLFWLLVFHLKGDLRAQTQASISQQIQSALSRHGFENVAVLPDGIELIVTYENRIYRYEVRAIREVLQLVAKQVSHPMSLVLIPQNRGIPITAVMADSNVCRSFIEGKGGEVGILRGIEVTLNVEPYWRKLKNQPRMNSSAMKCDVFVHPQFNVQFGNVYDAIESQINVAPAASTSLWKGMSLSAQWIFPIQNELGYEGDYGRPGLLTLNQTFRLPSSTFLSGTVGYFSEHRYGGDLEVKKFWMNGRWAATVNAGFTGFAAYLKRVWYYSDDTACTYLITGEYRFSKFDFIMKAGYGKFLYGDKGWRFDVFRQFGEAGVGFFAIRTDAGKNGGFTLSIPIFPSKRLHPGRIRVSPALDFPWSYRYKGLATYGIQYETRNSVDGFMKNLNPDFVENQFSTALSNN